MCIRDRHVGAHQCTVCVVVLQEGDHCRCHGNNHPRRHVHEVRTLALYFDELVAGTGIDLCMQEAPVFIQRFVCLRNDVFVLHVCGHVDHFVGDDARLLVHPAVRRLDEAILVDPGKGSQIGDQADVRTFRRLNWAHAPIVAVVYVANFESGAVLSLIHISSA